MCGHIPNHRGGQNKRLKSIHNDIKSDYFFTNTNEPQAIIFFLVLLPRPKTMTLQK